MKKNGKRIMSIGLSMVMAAAIFFAVGVQTLAYTETTGTVSSDNVKVRESASTTATQVSSLKNGDKIDIVDEATDSSGYVWYKIRVNKNQYGYVRSDLVSKAGGSSSSSSASATATTTTNTTKPNAAAATLPSTTVTSTDPKSATITEASVNVREGAGTAYNSVGKVTKGDTVTITGEATGTDNKTWYQVTFGNNKQGFIRSDLLKVGEAAPAEATDTPVEGVEPAEGEGEAVEGENAEGGETEGSQAGTAVTSEAGDGHYSLVYVTDEEGNAVWYLYDNIEGYRVKVDELIEAARSSDEVNKLVKNNSTYKTILIVLAIVIAALVIGVILLAFKLRESTYYEDEEEEEYDRYEKPSRRRARDAEDEEEEERPRRRAAEERTVRPNRDRADSERPSRDRAESDRNVRPSRREEPVEDRAPRGRKASDYEEERPSRRNPEERPSRPSRREEPEERAERQPKRAASYRNSEPADEPRETTRRKPKNFIGDEDDFEFEFLDLDDDK